MIHPFLLLLVTLLLLIYLVDTAAELLNLKRLKDELPQEFRDSYDPKKYKESLLYQREGTRFELFQNTINFVLLLAFTLLGGFNEIDLWVRSLGWGTLPTGLAFIGALGVLGFVVEVPFSLYQTFILEEKYGFNKTTLKTFVGDLLKGCILSILLGGSIFAGLIFLLESTGSWAWLYCWLGITFFQILLMYLAPAFILPLFNRFEPLPSGELRSAIEDFARTRKFQLNEIYVMDGSKRSTKSNAFFTGFGRFRKLVLFDTLIKNQTQSEMIAVLAHEIGHFEKKHIFQSFVFSVFSTGIVFFILGKLVNSPVLFQAFGIQTFSVYMGIVLVFFCYSPLSKLLSILQLAISRRNEYEADRFAVETYKKPEALITALKKLSVDHLSHLTPHPFKVILDYSHPPILERIRAIRSSSS